jgi:hypothetical protein
MKGPGWRPRHLVALWGQAQVLALARKKPREERFPAYRRGL